MDETQDMVALVSEGRGYMLRKVLDKDAELLAYNLCKNIEEQLKKLAADFKFLLENFLGERIAKRLSLLMYKKISEGRFWLRKTIPNLKSRLISKQLKAKQIEECVSLPSGIEALFQKARNSEQFQDSLCALKAKIFSINVLDLQRLIDKPDDARGLIDNKDVLLMIGNTDSDKSTNILKFLGYNLKLGKFGKLTTLVPTGDLHKDHNIFYISLEAQSCTRYIDAVAFPDKMQIRNTPESRKTLVICGSPGLGESAGVKVQIANGVGIINALNAARSVRVVVHSSFRLLGW